MPDPADSPDIRFAAATADADPLLAGFALAASEPYATAILCPSDFMRTAYAGWIARPTSEIARDHWRAALIKDAPAGAYAALPATRLAGARRADILDLFGRLSPDERAQLMTRLKTSQILFGPPPPDSLYLSKIAVAPGQRGKGIGAALVRDCIATARAGGFAAVALDVHQENTAAIALYHGLGFETVGEGRCADPPLAYLALRLKLSEP